MTRSISARRQRCERGFTLVELLITVAIIGILSAIAINSVRDAVYRARTAVLLEEWNTVHRAVNQYVIDYSAYPHDQNPGIEPPELTPYLKDKVRWVRSPFYEWDYENWSGIDGNPDHQGWGASIGLSCTTDDAKLVAALQRAYSGNLVHSHANAWTFVIVPPTTPAVGAGG